MINRKIRETGLPPLPGYLLVLVAFILLSEYIFQKSDFAKYLVMLTCLSVQFKLSEKSRSDFLLSTFGNKTKLGIRVIENITVCIPFVSILIYKSFFVEAGILFILSNLLALFSFESNLNFTIPTPFSKRPFEFSVGFRKTFFIFPVAYAITVIAIIADNLNLGIFSMLLVFLTTYSYYTKPEQEFYVWVHSTSPKVFLKNKLTDSAKNALLLIAPIVICLLMFYPTEFELTLLFLFSGLLFLFTVILAKYSVYPGEMNLPEGIVIAICIYFPPLLLAVMPFFYTKSINHLKMILNDQD